MIGSEAISFQGQLSPQEFRAIQAIMMRRLAWFQIGAIAVIVVMGIGFGHVPFREHDRLSLALYWLPLLLVLLLFWWSRRVLFRRGWTQNKLIQQPFHGSVSESGIDWRSDSSHWNLPWDMLHKVKLTDRLVLVYSSPVQAYPFPRSFFASDDDWTRFRALVERKLPRSHGTGR